MSHRLQAFLDLTANRTWSATLRTVRGTRRLANTALESRSREWRLCFRAGRATVEAARAFAQSWLAELRAPH